jgi:hypothetical protein
MHHHQHAILIAIRRKTAYVQPLESDAAGYYHGGDVLYTLTGVRGIWHEQCLEGTDEQ